MSAALQFPRSHGNSTPACTPHAQGFSRSSLTDEPSRVTVFFGAVAALLFLALMLSAFNIIDLERPLTAAEVAEQAHYCRAHGQQPIYFTNGDDTRIRSVQCRDKL